MADDLKQLIRVRGSIKQKLTNVEKYVTMLKMSEPNKKPPLSEVEIRYGNNETIFRDFEEVQLKIEILCDETQLPDHYLERENFESRFSIAMGFLSDYIRANTERQPKLANSPILSPQVDPLQGVIVPKIKLPIFKGDYEHWLEFKTTFISVIHSNMSISKTQKFQLLRASLEGYAKRLIDNFEFIEDNYDPAWSRLCQRFDNKRVLINNHIKSIYNLESMHKESSTQLRQLLDNLSNHLAALDGLHLSKDILWEILITYISSIKLDKATYRDWKDFKGQGDLPTLDEFMEFLRDKADLLEVIHDKNPDVYNQHHKQNVFTKHPPIKHSQNNVSFNNGKCNFCRGQHLIYNCPDFLKLDVPIRIEQVRKLKLCSNCLRTSHLKDKCHLGSCQKCNKRHSTLLHLKKEESDSAIASTNTVERSTVSTSTNTDSNTNLFTPNHNVRNTVLLSTVVFNVKDNQGRIHQCRALLDSGAQSNFVTEKFCEKLQLPLKSTKLSIKGINQVVSNLTKKCDLTILSRFNNFTTTFVCYVIPTISNEIPSYRMSISNWNIPDHIQLSDPQFQEPSEIDVLIGAGLFWDVLSNGKITLGKGLPVLQNTKLGWVISGVAPIQSSMSICNFSKIIISEDEQLKRFWELEEVVPISIMSPDEIECEKLFENSVARKTDGRFVVKMPMKHTTDLLGDSYDIAMRRFLHLERKFAINNSLKSQYTDFINEYILLGHMTQINISKDSKNFTTYYLPHHGVIKENTLTTKLRVVFDGSCPSDSGWSLNDLQFIGPKVQNDIVSILLRFRTYAFVVSADITKMYRQVDMHPDHRPLQRIIWRSDPSQPFSIYQLNTVTYGTTSAPYLAIKCLKSLALQFQVEFPKASSIILNDIYVDDLLTGSDDVKELSDVCRRICVILNTGKFSLRKWTSNNTDVLSDIDTSNDSLGVLTIGEQESSKTLGIKWISHSDILKYDISQSSQLNSKIACSKRQILSDISQIYDPLGLVSPCIIIAKMIIQHLWGLKLGWDEPVPSEFQTKWSDFRGQLPQLNSLSIPRNAVGNAFTLLDIHCFSDASKEAYSSCIYLRSQDVHGNFNVKLLCSKTKVAPIKSISIPRLELCAALLTAQLADQVKISLPKNVPYFFWSDSQVVLHWIYTEPHVLETFVGNRVAKIQELTKYDKWLYVNTTQNPADVASRGMSPKKLLECDIWWNGPEYLHKSEKEWPSASFQLSDHDIPEIKKKKGKVFLSHDNSLDIFTKYSNLNKLKKVFAYCIRFIDNVKTSVNERRRGPLTPLEISSAYKKLIKIAQCQSFHEEISLLSKGAPLTKKHNLSSLCPFLDTDGLLKVGGRLKFSSLDSNIKHPILLSSNHDLTKLIFRHKHTYLLHPGPQLLLASVRQRYWPIGGKVLAKNIVRNCVTCFKFKPLPAVVPMGSLPDHRLIPALPFQNIGVDYAGPYYLKDRKGRGSKISKCWICVFVCFVSKAIHIELITDMTSECFLSCLKRFISRRGLPSHIYSDNGSTFKGAYNELQSFGQFMHKIQDKIRNYSTNLNISWHFTPPYSPNFDGLWEAAVKSMKHHLKRTLLDTILTYEEFSTLLCQIEGILNSRPLFALSSDPNDLEPITPSHFLIGRPIISPPSPDLQHVPDNRLSRLQHVQKLQQQFWQRFSKEYISQLHQLYKWKIPASSELSPGTLVLIKNDNLPPNKWSLGRIQNLVPGKDGVHRVAIIHTSKGLTRRSTRHLHPLPLEDEVHH